MVQVTARLTDDLSAALHSAAEQLIRSRADVIRQAIEYQLDDVEDLRREMHYSCRLSAVPLIDQHS